MVPGSCSKVIEAVVGLVVMLIWMSYATGAVETHCDARQDGAHCYGPLGGTVFIQLVNSASEMPNYKIKHRTSIILRGKKKHVNLDPPQSKYLFVHTNGTFSIKNLSTNDSGEYTLEIFDSDGWETQQRTLQLLLEAPVSSVQLISECLSQGQVKVSCLSEGGGNPQYNWTLDGHILTYSMLFSVNNETNIIILRQNISGRLVCSVTTKVSSLFKEKHVSACDFVNCTSNGVHISKWVFKEHNTLCAEPLADKHNIMDMLPILVGALGTLLIVLGVNIGIVCVKRKKQNSKEGQKEDQKLTNADQRRRQPELIGDPPVEYGKVKKQLRYSDSRKYGKNMDNSVYGNVECSVYANV